MKHINDPIKKTNGKVYQGNKPIEEHIKVLTSLYGMPEHAAHKIDTSTSEQKYIVTDITTKTQSIQVRKLKMEAGL